MNKNLNVLKPALNKDETITVESTAHILGMMGIDYTEEQLKELFVENNYSEEDKKEFMTIYNKVKESNFTIPKLPKSK